MATTTKLPAYSTELFTDIYDNADDFVSDYKTLGIPTTISETSATTLYYLLYGRYGNNPIANYDETQWKFKLFSVVFQYGPTWEKKLDVQKVLREMSESDIMQGFMDKYTKQSTATSYAENTANNSSSTTVTGGSKTVRSGATETENESNTSNTATDSKNNTTIADHAYNPALQGEYGGQYTKLAYVDQQNATQALDNASSAASSATSGLTTTMYKDVTDTGESSSNNATSSYAQNIANTANSASDSSNQVHTLAKLDAYEKLWALLTNDVTNEFINKFMTCFKKFVQPSRTWIYQEDED